MTADSSRRLIAFSLWGSDPKYTRGAVVNALQALQFYPGWQCLFWVGENVADDVVEILLSLPHCTVKNISDKEACIPRPMLRFLVVAEPCERVILRDADSRFSDREKQAVLAWIDSGRDFHSMRDHAYHNLPMLGGMWGRKG